MYPMPSLTRFLAVVILLCLAVYGAMYVLGNYVEPRQGELSVRIPSERFQR